jgi:HJR/Mrr/RecB family endonuclease
MKEKRRFTPYEIQQILIELCDFKLEIIRNDQIKHENARISNEINDDYRAKNILINLFASPNIISYRKIQNDVSLATGLLYSFVEDMEKYQESHQDLSGQKFVQLTSELRNSDSSSPLDEIFDQINQLVKSLIIEILEEREMEEFENSWHSNKSLKQKSPDFDQMNGHEFESFLGQLFEKLGYSVNQTKGSGDQGGDLVLFKDDVYTVVQAKKYQGKVSNTAIQEVVAAKKFYNCSQSMVVTTGEFTRGAVELALANDVILWDKMILEESIRGVNVFNS